MSAGCTSLRWGQSGSGNRTLTQRPTRRPVAGGGTTSWPSPAGCAHLTGRRCRSVCPTGCARPIWLSVRLICFCQSVWRRYMPASSRFIRSSMETGVLDAFCSICFSYAAYLRALAQADVDRPGALGELIARGIIDAVEQLVMPISESWNALVPLAALADDRVSADALKMAARRGRLRALQDETGHWRSTRDDVDAYLASKHRRATGPSAAS